MLTAPDFDGSGDHGMKHQSRAASWRKRNCLLWTVLIVATMSTSGCVFSPRMHVVTVAPDARSFVETKSEQPYVPWGTNYYDPNTGWYPQIWKQFDPERVERHFQVMSELGVNCARVFLAAAAFQPDVETIEEEALRKLDTLIKIARRAGIRLILTGPDHWEGEVPYWQPDRFAGEEALKALENFWTVVGQRYRDEPAILAWDLVNEPQMPWALDSWAPRWHTWLESKYQNFEGLKAAWDDELEADEAWGSIEFAKDTAEQDNPRLLDWQRFREHLADQWVERQVKTIRSVDPTHMITIGYVQLSYPVVRPGDPHLYPAFNPRRQAQWLDFISIHFYPLMGRPYGSRAQWDRNLAYLRSILAYCHVGKPVVLGDYGWYGGGAPQGRPLLTEEEQERWLHAEVEASRRLAHGWLSWPFADTPESTDMSLFGGLVKPNMLVKVWAVRFRTYARHLDVVPQPTPDLPDFDFEPALTATLETMIAMQDEYAELVGKAVREAGPIPQMELELPEKKVAAPPLPGEE